MAQLDIIAGDGFSTRELSDAISIVPNQWGRIGEMGLFTPKPLRTAEFSIEAKGGFLQLIQSSQRGTNLPGRQRGKRALHTFRTERFGLEGRVTAEDIAAIRAFGSETELMQVQDVINDELVELRASLDITREWLRATALQGLVKDADGTTILDLHSAFGITKKSVDFTFATSGTDTAGKARSVKRHIEQNLLGDVMTGAHVLCSPEFWDEMMEDEAFKRAYDFYMGVNPMRDDVRKGFDWQGLTWEEYLGEASVPNEDGTMTIRRFVPQGEAFAFPVGTRNTFRQYNSPADFIETVNQPGMEYYAKATPDPKGRYVDIDALMQTLPICMRPGATVRLHSSN